MIPSNDSLFEPGNGNEDDNASLPPRLPSLLSFQLTLIETAWFNLKSASQMVDWAAGVSVTLSLYSIARE